MHVIEIGTHRRRNVRSDRRFSGQCVWLPWCLVCCLVAGGHSALAGGGPENVAVVVNADSWASQTVANHYVHWRQIPPSNLVYLEGLTSFERTDVDTFREKILVPVFQKLYERNVLEHIDYILYSSDFPTAIDAHKDLGGRKLERYLSPVGSLTGLTYLYKPVLMKNPLYINLLTNFYARRPVRDILTPPTSPADSEAFTASERLIQNQQWDEAVRALQALAQRVPGNRLIQYNLACCLARAGQPEAALQALAHALDAGWYDAAHTRRDADLESLRSLPAFDALLQKMEQKEREPIEVQPTCAFRSKYTWDQTGSRVRGDGPRYVLSTMLAVTSGRGNSVREALDYLQRSVAADATAPRGTIYLVDVDKEIRCQTRKWAFPSVVHALEGTGLRGEIIPTALPEHKSDVAGCVAGTASFNWPQSGSTMLPGAICEHLTSYGGAMEETAGQTPLTEFLRYGAAGSSGTVVEPMSVQPKFPDAFLHLHYVRGASLAEAFYQSVYGPYQLLIVGDALCQPWASRLHIELGGVQPQQRVSGQIVLEPRVVGAEASGAVDHFELFIDGQQRAVEPAGRTFTLDTATLGDGWHELRLVAVAAGPLETQSRLILPLLVDNHGGTLSLTRDRTTSQEVVYGEPLVVRAQVSGAQRIAVLHNSRELGQIHGADGTLQIDTRRLGLGPVALQAAAQVATRTCLSAPLAITVLPPPAFKPLTGIDAKKLVAGLELTIGQDKPIVVQDTKDAKTETGNWLSDLKPAEGKPLKLDAFFTVSEDDVYQFQIEGNSVSEVRVDGESIWPPAPAPAGPVGWTMLPVHLQKGLHRFTLVGTTARTPVLRVRFGGRGCTALNAARFKHLE